MKKLGILLGLGFLAACGGSGGGSSAPPPYEGFVQPTGTIAVNFKVDDTANRNFAAGEFGWKGSMVYDATTRKVTLDSTWGGPWADLYDDGPWDQKNTTTGLPGHEPKGAVAGDHIWGVTIFVTPPATGTATYEYGLIDRVYETSFGNGWIWQGSNGQFVVAAADVGTEKTAAGLTIPAATGTQDMIIALDTANLGAGTWDTSAIKVKSSAWGWSEITLADDGTKGDAVAGDGIYTLKLSQWVGTGHPYKHTGLLGSGAKPEFVWVLNGVEYKDGSGVCESTGVSAQTGSGSTFTAATVAINASNNNTYITIP